MHCNWKEKSALGNTSKKKLTNVNKNFSPLKLANFETRFLARDTCHMQYNGIAIEAWKIFQFQFSILRGVDGFWQKLNVHFFVVNP